MFHDKCHGLKIAEPMLKEDMPHYPDELLEYLFDREESYWNVLQKKERDSYTHDLEFHRTFRACLRCHRDAVVILLSGPDRKLRLTASEKQVASISSWPVMKIRMSPGGCPK